MAFPGGTMIATILKIPQGASTQGDAHFARFIKEAAAWTPRPATTSAS